MIPDRFVICEFLHGPLQMKEDEEIDSPPDLPEPSPRTIMAAYNQEIDHKRYPYLSVTDVEWKRVHSEPISFFEDYYQDLNYNFAWDPASHSDMYIYSPESVIKV